ncbi:MAG: hypothetical protein KDA96_21655 [Planctomycetaceae bacterium]|nr:hypothetical protein [Planctomycetaceae bacterium]
MASVSVTTGSRFHPGLICGTADSGWRFGGIGFMMQSPQWRLCIRRLSDHRDRVTFSTGVGQQLSESARTGLSRRIATVLDLMRADRDGLHVEVLDAAPMHGGFGAGTQLALGVGAGIDVLKHGRRTLTARALASKLDRSTRSAVGTAGFESGGFLLDRGVEAQGDERRVERFSIPDQWRWVIVKPTDSVGLCGTQEVEFFQRRATMPGQLVRDLEKILLQQLIPALQQQDFDRFASALAEYGRQVGGFYADSQGGVFACDEMNSLAVRLQDAGFPGAAQSSWGPSIGIPAQSPAMADAVRDEILASPPSCSVQLLTVEPMNCGARILSEAPSVADDTRLI